MQELDQALARAFARADAADGPTVPPRPHFVVEPPPAKAAALAEVVPIARPPAAEVVLRWPETVLALERAHGDRFEHLADALIEARGRRGLKVILLTSCHRGEGRTTLLLTLARALARRPGRALLVDADLSGPMLARRLGLRPRVGLDDVIGRGISPAEALAWSADDNLTVLPLRGPASHPREFFAGPPWPLLMARLRLEFDSILVDGGPLFTGPGGAAMQPAADASILVQNRTLTGAHAVIRARKALEAGGIPLLGIAETFV